MIIHINPLFLFEEIYANNDKLHIARFGCSTFHLFACFSSLTPIGLFPPARISLRTTVGPVFPSQLTKSFLNEYV